MKIAVILLAVAGLVIYDWFHDKSLIKKAGSWVKYAVAFGGGLAFAAITSLPFFVWLSLAGVVILCGITYGTIVNFLVGLYNKVTKKTPTTTVGKV